MTESAVDVLVIGAGPSGLFAALELARHGVIARVVERDPVPHHQARATALQPGTLEILASAGVIDSVLASSEHLGFARLLDAGLGVVGEVAFAGAGSPWDHQCSLPQWRTEQILAERLTELGGSVDRGVDVVELDERDDRVLITLRRTGGDAERAEARWVIGAGGAHSLTRASMAEELTGGTYPGTALVADVRVRCPIRRDASTLIATPSGYVLLAALPDERCWSTCSAAPLTRCARACAATVRCSSGPTGTSAFARRPPTRPGSTHSTRTSGRTSCRGRRRIGGRNEDVVWL
jgi:2-polyprenyl-6-methoxyphenol hydroxylase-like FAD-dependent oxidoreductase